MSRGNVTPFTSAQLIEFHKKLDIDFAESRLQSFYGELSFGLREAYNESWPTNRAGANRRLDNFHSEYAGSFELPLGADDEEITSYAREQAGRCKLHKSPETMRAICARVGISPPDSDLPELPQMARMRDHIWWRRRLRKMVARKTERAYIAAGMVHVKANKYVSNDSIERLRQRHVQNKEMLESMIAVNEDGYELSLADAQEKSVANPRIRRNELMCRLAGFETIANEMNYVADFYTLTCPSRFHSRLSKTGAENPNYEGATPKEAQQYLCTLWARIRAKLQRENINVFGFRISEPHHDGCPHWHILLWVREEKREHLQGIARGYALSDSPDEPGAKKHRFTVEEIDPEKGSAVAYIAKYISKNIDGYGMEPGEQSSANRVRAWASTWGIRQFQQIGGPPVGVWRELRRLNGETKEESLETLNGAISAADAGNFAGYIRAQAGPTTPRDKLPIKLYKIQTGEQGQYGDVMPPQIMGVDYGPIHFLTRLHVWKITRKSKGCPPWSSVNNCTQGKIIEELEVYEINKNGQPGPSKLLLEYEKTRQSSGPPQTYH